MPLWGPPHIRDARWGARLGTWPYNEQMAIRCPSILIVDDGEALFKWLALSPGTTAVVRQFSGWSKTRMYKP